MNKHSIPYETLQHNISSHELTKLEIWTLMGSPRTALHFSNFSTNQWEPLFSAIMFLTYRVLIVYHPIFHHKFHISFLTSQSFLYIHSYKLLPTSSFKVVYDKVMPLSLNYFWTSLSYDDVPAIVGSRFLPFRVSIVIVRPISTAQLPQPHN